MRILIVTATYAPSINGVALSVKLQKDELIKKGHVVTVIAPTHPKQKKEKDIVRLPSIPNPKNSDYPIILPLPSDTSHFDLLDKKFDLIYFHHPFYIGSLVRVLAKIFKCPTIFFYHTQYEKYAEILMPKILPRKPIKKLVIDSLKRTMKEAKAVIVETDTIKGQLVKQGVKTPIYVITSGRNMPTIGKSKLEKLRGELDIKSKEKIIFHASRLSSEKNISSLINIFAEVREKFQNVILILAGDGPQKSELKDLAREKGLNDSIKFTGQIPNEKIFEYCSIADVFAYTSYTDTQAIVLLEAMISGLPIIGYKAPGPMDFVKNGKSGFLVTNNQEFAKKLIYLLKNPARLKSMSQKARELSKPFTLESSINKLEELFEKVAKNPYIKKD